MSLLNVRKLTVQFHTDDGNLRAADEVSFCVEPGEIVGLVGESGCGKSTLMRAVMGILPPQAEVDCDALEWAGSENRAAMVFQDPFTFLNPSLKVGVQLEETILAHQKNKSGGSLRAGLRRSAGIDPTEDDFCLLGRRASLNERAEKLLRMAGIERGERILGKYPFELSGGQRQRIVLAIALACEPELLIADEPTTALDVTVQKQLLGRLARIAAEQKMAMIIVSHDFGVVASLAERVLVMQEGRIVESGAVEQIYHDPQHPYTKRLIEDTKEMARPAWFGRQIKGKMHPISLRGTEKEAVSSRPAEEFLNISHLSRQYPAKQSLQKRKRLFGSRGHARVEESVQDISFSIAQGEHFGLVGESGCGKTTFARMLCGLTEPSSGQIYYKGELLPSIEGGRTKKQLQAVQMVFQSPYASLNPRHTVEDTLEEPLLLNGIRSRKMRREMVGEMLTRVGLRVEDAQKYPSEFSGGQCQRIAIARALLAKPDILVLDEPVSALDLTTQGQILRLLEEICRKQPLTWIFISHDLQVIRKMCGRVGVMYAGRIVESGNTKDVYEEPWHPYTKLLLQSILVPEPKRAKRKQTIWMGEEPDLEVSQEGCPFAGRCGYAMACCHIERPQNYRFGDREVTCFLYSEEHTGKRSANYEMTAQI